MKIPNISAEDRMEMLMRGLNPLDPKEVQAYRKGYGISKQEKEERLKTLLGEHTTNLGGANEKEILVEEGDPTRYMSNGNQGNDIANLRRQMDAELENYVSEPRTMPQPTRQPQRQRQQLNESAFDTDGLMGFDEPAKPRQSIEEIAAQGFNDAKAYLNSFVMNLKESANNNSYVNRMTLYKNLKLCLEAESRYKNNPQALQSYRTGVLKAEKAMLTKLNEKKNG